MHNGVMRKKPLDDAELEAKAAGASEDILSASTVADVPGHQGVDAAEVLELHPGELGHDLLGANLRGPVRQTCTHALLLCAGALYHVKLRSFNGSHRRAGCRGIVPAAIVPHQSERIRARSLDRGIQ